MRITIRNWEAIEKVRSNNSDWTRGKDPHPHTFSLTKKKIARFAKGGFRPY